MDFYDEIEIDHALTSIKRILDTGIFTQQNSNSPFFKPSFIAVLISLRDLMFKAEKYASRIDFNDDVDQSEKVKDVTGLIKFVRDALCHPDSDNHYIEDGNRFTFNVAFGQGCIGQIGERRMESVYSDDVCFFFGFHRIYLNRHVFRATKEAEANLGPLMNGGKGRLMR